MRLGLTTLITGVTGANATTPGLTEQVSRVMVSKVSVRDGDYATTGHLISGSSQWMKLTNPLENLYMGSVILTSVSSDSFLGGIMVLSKSLKTCIIYINMVLHN